MNRIARWMVAAAVMVSATAWAGPMSLWVGQTQTLYLFQKISKIEVSNPAVVKATRIPKVGLDLRAVAAGTSDVKIRCSDGTVYNFRIHSTHGAEVYSTNRNEPEHYQWSASSEPLAARSTSSAAVATAARTRKTVRRSA
jgi:Flp pilus assembly secretin CpaC